IYRIAPKGAKLAIPTFDPKTTEGLITAFKSHAVNVRNIGFVGLKAQGAKALPAVKKLLSDPNPYFQARAVWLLAQMGEPGLALVEKRLSHTDPQMRIVAFRALRFAGHRMLEHAAKLAKDQSPAVRREVALAMRNLSLAQCKEILIDVAKGYDGKDRWYLEAFGTGCSGKEAAMYEAVKAELKPGAPARWDDRFAGIAWRLHPATAIGDLAARARAESLPFEKRKVAMVPIGLTPTMSAVSAMVDIAKNGPKDSAAEARRWIDKQQKGLWARFDPKGVLTGKKTPKLTYTDAIVPKHLGQEVKLPSIEKILSLKGNAKAGKTLSARCVMCHSINGTGVSFGPALSAWGKGQPRQVIAKAIVDPDADIAHGYKGTEIKTKDGKTLQGFVTAEGDLVVIKVFGGKQVAVDAKDIASRTEVKGSFMVPAGKMGLTAQNVRDLVEFLKTGG
ncbi:MAG: c-type cytochrome, partial [Phycisphaeraceae bacterium]|nr:c-type cytochrome [Phycisphaeraceae bacterium]